MVWVRGTYSENYLFQQTAFGSYRMFVYFYFIESQNQLDWKSPEIIESNLLVCFSVFVEVPAGKWLLLSLESNTYSAVEKKSYIPNMIVILGK